MTTNLGGIWQEGNDKRLVEFDFRSSGKGLYFSIAYLIQRWFYVGFLGSNKIKNHLFWTLVWYRTVQRGPSQFRLLFSWVPVSDIHVYTQRCISFAGISNSEIAALRQLLSVLLKAALNSTTFKRWCVSFLFSMVFYKICRMVKV